MKNRANIITDRISRDAYVRDTYVDTCHCGDTVFIVMVTVVMLWSLWWSPW